MALFTDNRVDNRVDNPVDNPEVAYELLKLTDDNNDMNQEEYYIIPQFKWMEKLISCIFCIRATQLNKTITTTKYCACVMILTRTIIGLLAFSTIVFMNAIFIMGISKNYRHIGIHDIAFSLFFEIMFVSRILTQWYFYRHCNYPWYSSYNKIKTYSKIYIFIQKTCILLQVALNALIICLYCFIVAFLEFDYIELGFSWCAIFFPIFLTFVIQSIISFKYRYFIIQLIDNKDKTNANEVFDKYKKLYYLFKKEYNWTLKICVQGTVVSALCFLWVIGYEIINEYENLYMSHKSYAVIIACALLYFVSTILSYITSGCYLNETLELFQKTLWKQIEEDMDKHIYNPTLGCLISYIETHPIHITFGGLRVTKKSTIIFVLGFIASKIAAYLVRYLYS